MKKLLLFIFLCCSFYLSFGQSGSNAKLPSTAKLFTPSFYYDPTTPDSLNKIWYRNPLTNKALRLVNATEAVIKFSRNFKLTGDTIDINTDSAATIFNNFVIARNSHGDFVLLPIRYDTSTGKTTVTSGEFDANGGLQLSTFVNSTILDKILTIDGSGNVRSMTLDTLTAHVVQKALNFTTRAGTDFLPLVGPDGKLFTDSTFTYNTDSHSLTINELQATYQVRSVDFASTDGYYAILNTGESSSLSMNNAGNLRGFNYIPSGGEPYQMGFDPTDDKWKIGRFPGPYARILTTDDIPGGGYGTLTNITGVNANGFTWSIATSTTTPAITLTLQTASSSLDGELSHTDWSAFNAKQAPLVSGTNIKTINSASLLGSGNITLQTPLTAGTDYLAPTGSAAGLTGLLSAQVTAALGYTPYNNSNPSSFIALTALSATTPLHYNSSTGVFTVDVGSASQPGVISTTDWSAFNGKQAALISGTNIKTINSASLLGSGNIALQTPLTAGTDYLAPTGSAAGLTGLLSAQVIAALGYTPEDVANKSTNTSLGTSDVLYPSQKAVKTYTDNQVSALSTVYQPLENQRVSTTNSPTFAHEFLTEYADFITQAGKPTGTAGHLKMYRDSVGSLSYMNGLNRRTLKFTLNTDVTTIFPSKIISVLEDSTHAAQNYAHSISITTPSILYTTPVNFSNDGSGNFSATLALINQSANTVLAGPTSGGSAAPTMRLLVDADIPTSYSSFTQTLSNKSISGASNTVSNIAPASLVNSGSNTLRALQLLGSAAKALPVMAEVNPASNAIALTSGTIVYTACYLPAGATLTGVKWNQPAQGVYTATGYNGIGLYTVSGGTLTLQASTTTSTTLFKSGTNWNSAAFTSTYTATADQVVYVAYLYQQSAQTTAPTIAAMSMPGSYSNLDLANSLKLAMSQSGQTTLPSSVAASSLTLNSTMYYSILY